MDYQLLTSILGGIAILLILILRFKIPAFIALLIASLFVGVLAGLQPQEIMTTITEGMGGTLGFVATVVGLGAMFGAILEESGGANVITKFLLKKLGVDRAPTAMVLAGFIVAIPVFFEVAFILLVPIIYALQRQTKKSLLLYALPLLAGLAVTHAFIPPTPGPIVVAETIGADLGWVIFIGAIVGLPTAILSGLIFGKYISKKIYVEVPFENEHLNTPHTEPSISNIFAIIAIPIVLILLDTFTKSGILPITHVTLIKTIEFLGHPFSALLIANIVAWYVLGIKQGFSKEQLLKITTKSMGPAGMIILVTGAGGVFKQVLVNTGGGKMIAESLTEIGFPVILFSFIIAFLVRITQGSATVAMITAASLVAPILAESVHTNLQLACYTIAIAAGASAFSHVNDSGFWLVNQYIGLSEKQTFKTWTLMTGIIAFSGFLLAFLINSLFV